MKPTMTDLDNETTQIDQTVGNADTASAASHSTGASPAVGTERFRAHAAARLRGDTAEAARIAAEFTESEQRLHLMFLQSLFAAFVIEDLGSAPDPFDLAQLTKRLHDTHFRPEAEGGAAFIALRSEAMIRALFGEEFLLLEIPFGEQPGYMWAVMNELCGPDATDEDLDERCRLAAEFARDGVGSAAESVAASITETFVASRADTDTDTDTDEEETE
jgi:hypothetical protein